MLSEFHAYQHCSLELTIVRSPEGEEHLIDQDINEAVSLNSSPETLALIRTRAD